MPESKSKRRSGRISMELDVLLLGTDTTGKVIMEQTKTVMLSRHGAGIVSRYRFSPDDVLTLSLPGAAKEAEIRLLGQIGGEAGRYIYGVTFVDSDPHFWPMDFPDPEPFEPAIPQPLLECSRCRAREQVQQLEIEEDVYSVNGFILRPCAPCGTSTPWKKAEGQLLPEAVTEQASSQALPELRPVVAPSRVVAPARTNFTGAVASPPLGSSEPSLRALTAAFAAIETGLAEAPVASSGAKPAAYCGAYSGASAIPEFTSLSETQSSDARTSSGFGNVTAVLPPPEGGRISSGSNFQSQTGADSDVLSRAMSVREFDAHGRPVNRRRHVRIRVSFSACVRHASQGEEVVECENVSKGGACFHSLRQYGLDSTIEIAAPFSPGEAALFVPAKIKRVQAIPGTQILRYGVAYLKP